MFTNIMFYREKSPLCRMHKRVTEGLIGFDPSVSIKVFLDIRRARKTPKISLYLANNSDCLSPNARAVLWRSSTIERPLLNQLWKLWRTAFRNDGSSPAHPQEPYLIPKMTEIMHAR